MKRLIAVIMAFCTLLLSACGGTSSDPPEENGTPFSTIMTVVADRANEVDRLPLYEQIFSSEYVKTLAAAPVTQALSLSPSLPMELLALSRDRSEMDGVYYHEDYLPDDFDPARVGNQYDGYHREFGFVAIDRYAKQIQEMKGKALLSCKVLNTWVAEHPSLAFHIPPGTNIRPSHINQRYRIGYDVNSDIVTVESLIDETMRPIHSYSRFSVTYTPSGKLKVDGYSANFGDEVIHSESSIHYVEGEYYVVAGKNGEEEYLAATNFQTGEWVTISPVYHEVDGETTVDGTNYVLSYKENGYLVELSKNAGKLYLSDGRLVVDWTGTSNFLVSLDFFDGWSQVESTDDNCLLTLSTQTGEHLFYPQTHHPNPEKLEGDGFYFNLSYRNGFIPELLFKRSNALKQQGIEWTLEDAERNFKALEGALGITPKDTDLSALMQAMRTQKTRESGFTAASLFLGCDITYEVFSEISDELIDAPLTLDDLCAMKNTEILAFDAQKPDYDYFEFLDFTLSGKAAFDESAVALDLSNVTATLAPSVLLKTDATYHLAFFFVSDDARTDAYRLSSVYGGKEMTFSGNLRLPRENFPIGESTYTLICYLADDADNRISKIMTVKGDHSGTYDLSTKTRKTVLTFSDAGVTVENCPLQAE